MLARLRDRLPMDVVERHMKREEDLQSIEDCASLLTKGIPPHRRRRGRRQKRAMGAPHRPRTARRPVLSDYAQLRGGAPIFGRRQQGMPSHGLVASTGPGPRDGLEPPGWIKRRTKEEAPTKGEEAETFESVRAPRPVHHCRRRSWGKACSYASRLGQRRRRNSNPESAARDWKVSKPSIDARGHYYLKLPEQARVVLGCAPDGGRRVFVSSESVA